MNSKRIVFSLMCLFLVFFFLPILIYSFFSKYFGMQPPFKIDSNDLFYLIFLQILQMLVFWSFFWMIVRKREKTLLLSLSIALLLYLLSEFSPKLIHAFTFQYTSTLYLKISLIAGLLTYLIGGILLGKFFKEKNKNITL